MGVDIQKPTSHPSSSQGVVTYMFRVEAFVTRIKIESSDQNPFREPIKRSR